MQHLKIWQHFHEYPFARFEYSESMLRKNAHIRSLHLEFSPKVKCEHLQLVHSIMPHIENLTLSEFKLNHVEIRFENVTTLSLVCKSVYCQLGKLHVPKLQTLHVNFNTENIDELQTFLTRHNHLTELYLVYDNSKRVFHADIVRDLLRIHDKLIQFRLIHDELECVMIRETLTSEEGDEWDITYARRGLLFKRKSLLINDDEV